MNERTYEAAAERIEQIIKRLDAGDAGLRDTLDLVKEGRELVDWCATELEAVFGVRELDLGEVTTEALLGFNDPAIRRVGMPGGGGVMRASDLALFYQAVLHNPGEMWKPDVLDDARTNVRNRLPDRMTGIPANRTLGLLQAGDDGFSHVRGMGRTVSPGTVGHNGAKGQIAWGDPASGLSLGYCTNGLDEHAVREPRRTTAIASLAAACVAD